MIPITRHPARCATGFSLVEIMVGMVIGMIGIIVMMQVFSVSEANKRTTTGGDDAQNNGAIALYGMQRDISQGAYGISGVDLFGCSLLLRAGVMLTPLAPVMINPVDATGAATIPAGDPNTDTVLVVYGNAGGSAQGDAVISQTGASIYKPKAPTSYARAGGDWIIAAPKRVGAMACNLTLEKINSLTPAEPAAPTDVNVTTGVASANILYNLGQAPKILAYAIRSGNLTLCDYVVNDCGDVAKKDNAAYWVPIASNIVSMRAQYGKDTSATVDTIVDKYEQGVDVPPTVASVQCGWVRISAVRLALVARSSQYDKDVVTAGAPSWMGTTAGNPVGSASTLIDLTKKSDGSANSDWQHYRYKVFQTVVPMRNVTWMDTTGC